MDLRWASASNYGARSAASSRTSRAERTGKEDVPGLSTGLVNAGCLIWTGVLIYFTVRDVLLLDDARRSPPREERVDNPLSDIVIHNQVAE